MNNAYHLNKVKNTCFISPPPQKKTMPLKRRLFYPPGKLAVYLTACDGYSLRLRSIPCQALDRLYFSPAIHFFS